MKVLWKYSLKKAATLLGLGEQREGGDIFKTRDLEERHSGAET